MTQPHLDRAVVAIAALVLLESIAMFNHINGTVLRLVIVAVAGLGGFSLARITKKEQR